MYVNTISGCFAGLEKLSINQRNTGLAGNQVETNDENCVGYRKCCSIIGDDLLDEPSDQAVTQSTCLKDGSGSQATARMNVYKVPSHSSKNTIIFY